MKKIDTLVSVAILLCALGLVFVTGSVEKAVLISVIFASVAGSLWYNTRNERRISLARSHTSRFAEGDMRVRIDANPDGDSLDRLFYEINKMAINLTGIMGEIKGSTGILQAAIQSFQESNVEVIKNAEIVKSNSETIASAAEQSSASVESIGANAGHLNESIQSVAAAVEEMSATAESIDQQSRESYQSVVRSQEQANNANRAVAELSELAKQIGVITQTIENIASQTNLLALNATIEAASAGEAGKGFSVVASEVKQLSRQTADATSKIRSQIESITSVVDKVTSLINQTSSSVNSVFDSSQRTMNSVSEQRLAIQELSRNVSMSSISSKEIVGGLGEIAIGSRDAANSVSDVHRNAVNTVTRIDATNNYVMQIATTSKRLDGVIKAFKFSEKYIEFTPSLRVGVEAMDKQHSRLFDLINQLASAVSTGKNNSDLLVIIDGLADYTVTHFRDEEEYMRKTKYTGLDAHIQIHKKFVDTVLKARKDFSEGKGMVGSELIKFLTDWLIQHIGGQDKKYGT